MSQPYRTLLAHPRYDIQIMIAIAVDTAIDVLAVVVAIYRAITHLRCNATTPTCWCRTGRERFVTAYASSAPARISLRPANASMVDTLETAAEFGCGCGRGVAKGAEAVPW